MVKAVSALLDRDLRMDPGADEGEIAEQVDELVAHELVGKSQTAGRQESVVPQHEGIRVVAAAGEALRTQRFDFGGEAEGPSRCELRLEDVRIEGREHVALAADARVGEVDRVVDPEPVAGRDPDAPIAVRDLELARHLELPPATPESVRSPARRRRADEESGAAVERRDLAAADFDPRVVDTEREQRGEQVLDRRHPARARRERRRPGRRLDGVGMGGNHDLGLGALARIRTKTSPVSDRRGQRPRRLRAGRCADRSRASGRAERSSSAAPNLLAREDPDPSLASRSVAWANRRTIERERDLIRSLQPTRSPASVPRASARISRADWKRSAGSFWRQRSTMAARLSGSSGRSSRIRGGGVWTW